MKDLRSRPLLTSGLALLGFFGSLATSPASAAKRETIVLASGPSGGVYHRLAEQMRDQLKTSGRDVRIEPKPDCAESLAWLEEEPEDGEVRFAFAQQDAAREFRSSPQTPIRIVDRTAFDYLHIFVRKSLHVESIAALAGRNIWLGEKGSATRSTADHLLDHLGIGMTNPQTYEDLEQMAWPGEPGDLKVEEFAVDGLRKWFESGRLDAAMLVSPPGNSGLCSLMIKGDLALLPLRPFEVRTLRAQEQSNDSFFSQIGFDSLPASTYINQKKAVTSLVVPVLLLTREETELATAKKVRAAARVEWEKIVKQSRENQGCQIPPASPQLQPIAATGLKLLEGIESIDPPRPTHLQRWRWEALAAALLAALGIVFRRWLRRRVRRVLDTAYQLSPLIRRLVLIIAVGMAVITYLTYRVERETNENFSTLAESWWSITVYIFSGLEDRVPYTPEGKVLGTLGLFMGWICSAIATGWTAGMYVRRDRQMPRKLENHCLLLNWNDRGADLIEELRHSALRESERIPVIVVVTDDENPKLHQLKQVCEDFDDVYLSFGDPSNETSLRKAHPECAHTVIVLADERHGDDRTIGSILKLHKIAREAGRDDLHVVAELVNASNDASVDELAKSFPGLLESVSGLKLRTCLLSQAAISQGLIGFYKDLLSVDENSNEVYAEDIPPEAVGQTFPNYAAFVMRTLAAEESSPVVPVGVQRKVDGRIQVLTNPRTGKEGYVLQHGDKLVLIAYGPPSRKVLPVPQASEMSTAACSALRSQAVTQVQ